MVSLSPLSQNMESVAGISRREMTSALKSATKIAIEARKDGNDQCQGAIGSGSLTQEMGIRVLYRFPWFANDEKRGGLPACREVHEALEIQGFRYARDRSAGNQRPVHYALYHASGLIRANPHADVESFVTLFPSSSFIPQAVVLLAMLHTKLQPMAARVSRGGSLGL